jgi:hypothetical protein
MKKQGMKIKKLSYKNIALSSLMVLALFAACKKEDIGSKELLVYIKGEFGSPNNVVTAALTQTPLTVWGNKSFDIPAYATREVAQDVQVFVSANNQLVGQFNKENNRKSVLLPANTYKISSSQVKINAGSFVSDPLKVEITNAAALTDTNGYVLPLTITKIEGSDKGVVVSSNQATAYLHIPYSFTNVDTTQVPLAGATMSRTGWNITVSNTTTGALGPAMVDGNNATAWRSSNSGTAAKYVIVNVGSAQTLKGFRLVPNYVMTPENATRISVSSSTDSTTWTFQGVWRGTGPSATSSAASPDIKGINFLQPVQAKFFRFDIEALVSGNRVGIGELNAAQ